MYTGPNTGSPYVVAGGDDTPIPAHMRSAYGYGYRAAPAEPEIELGRAVRILKLDGDLLEVENITAEDDVLTCAPLQPELAHVRVRLWVPRDALVPVLDHPITVQLDEHAEITLSPGVPAFATAVEDEFHVRASGITLKVKLPAVPTARWHAPGRQTDATGAVGTLGAWYGMTLAGKTFPPMGPAGRQLGQLYGDAAGTTWIFADEIEDGEARVRVKNRCLEVGGVVVTDSRSPAPSAGATPAASRRRLLDRPPAILAGTTLRWEDGTAAGVTVAPVTFGGTPRKQGEDVCFGVTAEAGAPELCASATDVAAAPAGQSESDGLVVTANPGWGMQSEVQHALGDELWENYGDVRECFRKHVKTKGGYNTASANVSLQVKSDGKVHAYWASAWTARGESRSLQRCIEGELAEWTVERPPAEDTSLSLYLVATRT